MKKNRIKIILLSTVALISPMLIWAQNAVSAPVAESAGSGGFSVNVLMAVVAAILLLPVVITGNVFINTVEIFQKDKAEKRKNTVAKTLLMLMGFLCISPSLFAETKAGFGENLSSSTMGLLLFFVILLEVITIMFFTTQTNKFLKLIENNSKENTESTVLAKSETPAIAKESLWHNLWNKMNRFQPLEKEADIDLGHSYDGIRELDNITPPWFVTAFVASILFAFVYMYRMHVSHNLPSTLDEYKTEMADAAEEQKSYLANSANNIDENTVKMLGADDIAAGQVTFTAKCTPCHGPNGASMPGGVGPNLTDDNWIHGGKINDVFKSIKYGWPEKGMISWKEQLSPKQIAQVASFVKSIHGTVKTGGKDPQGDLYKDDATASAITVTKDTSATK